MKITSTLTLSVIFISCLLLNGCAGMNQLDPKFYHPAQGKALLFIYRPSAFISGGGTSRFSVNDQYVGEMRSGYLMLGLNPGSHLINAVFSSHQPQLTISARPGEKIYVRFTTNGQLVQVANATGDRETLDLVYSDTKITFMSQTHTTQEDIDWKQCESARTLAICQRFIAQYPNTFYIQPLIVIMQEIQVDEAKKQLENKFERDKALPIEVRRDKYMVALAAHLKNERYAQSMQYFEWLERLNTKLSDSFYYFYGEALLKTGNPSAAIEKLYAYITEAGSSGKYYKKALEMVNQAETMEQNPMGLAMPLGVPTGATIPRNVQQAPGTMTIQGSGNSLLLAPSPRNGKSAVMQAPETITVTGSTITVTGSGDSLMTAPSGQNSGDPVNQQQFENLIQQMQTSNPSLQNGNTLIMVAPGKNAGSNNNSDLMKILKALESMQQQNPNDPKLQQSIIEIRRMLAQ